MQLVVLRHAQPARWAALGLAPRHTVPRSPLSITFGVPTPTPAGEPAFSLGAFSLSAAPGGAHQVGIMLCFSVFLDYLTLHLQMNGFPPSQAPVSQSSRGRGRLASAFSQGSGSLPDKDAPGPTSYGDDNAYGGNSANVNDGCIDEGNDTEGDDTSDGTAAADGKGKFY
jgi:hypothetical protein